MIVKGLNGQVELGDQNIAIKRKGLLAVVSKGFAGEKSIPISAITSIHIKSASFFTGNGFIKFCYGGTVERQGSLKEAASDENAVIFGKKSNEDFAKLKIEIERIKNAVNINQVSPQASIADEIEKLSNLKEKGIISEEEFSNKKLQLLEKI